MRCILKWSLWIAQTGALVAILGFGQSFTPAGVAEIPELYSDFVPSWTGGVLVSIENRNSATPIIHSFDETGQEVLPIALSIPGAQTIHIEGYSHGKGGMFALAGWTLDRENHRECFLSLVSPDHKTLRSGHNPMTITDYTIDAHLKCRRSSSPS